MAKASELVIKLRLKSSITLWDAIKLRIAGKKAEKLLQTLIDRVSVGGTDE